jgi:hypothetical protein
MCKPEIPAAQNSYFFGDISQKNSYFAPQVFRKLE